MWIEMTAHIIYDNEIKIILKCAENMYTPPLGREGEPRMNYQTIFHTLGDCKNRFLKEDGGCY
jgi:hypothetical protein